MQATIYVLSPVASHRSRSNVATLQRLSSTYRTFVFETYGMSEVSRARQEVATKAFRHLEAHLLDHHADAILWLDADCSVDLSTFARHLRAVRETGLAIAGRYPQRQRARIAASHDPDRLPFERGPWSLSPVHAGMGGLLVPTDVFLDHCRRVPVERDDEGNERLLICAPRIEQDEEGRWRMTSEDFDYCRQLQGQAWFARHAKEGQIDYGHASEVVQRLPNDFDHAIVKN